jgi:hypothetical protein
MKTLGVCCVTALLGLGWPTAAVGHGPCNCSFPQVGEAGAKVTARTQAYRVVFNPRPSDYGRAMTDTGYASSYQPGAATTTVLSRPVSDPVRRATYRVPAVPPGVYLVLIFDGSEGGSHSTWDYFHVLGAAPATPGRPAVAPSSQVNNGEGDLKLVPLAAYVAAGVAIGAVAMALRGRLRRRKS